MRTQTGTFELRDNDIMMRELTYAETSEVVGGAGFAEVAAFAQSGAGSSLSTSNGFFFLATTNTSAVASISASFHATGANNSVGTSALAEVF
jgi:hypothetical protein